MQEPDDVARWESLGVKTDRIHPVGSIKYDPENVASHSEMPRAVLETLGVAPHRPILLAGSTHPGEEEILGRIFLELRSEFPDLFLIIAPRHVERTTEISSRLGALGLTTARRSKPRDGRTDCFLLDTTGELRDWYSIATIVFMGKSLTARGGQNPVEAIVADRPVVFGPHMENFANLSRALVAAGGALQPNDEGGLTNALSDLLRDASRTGAARAAGPERPLPASRSDRTNRRTARKAAGSSGLKSLASAGRAPDIGRSPDPIVQWPRTPPFHGGNTGSNPVRVATLVTENNPHSNLPEKLRARRAEIRSEARNRNAGRKWQEGELPRLRNRWALAARIRNAPIR